MNERIKILGQGVVVIAAFLIGGLLAVTMTAPDLQRRAYEKGLNEGYWNGQAKGCVEKAIYDEWREDMQERSQ